MPELSIIVPVYKTEKYLPKCIDSILSQTFTDFELILIDDGSPDRCGEICDEYAAKDGRIIVIHQENRGVSAARNAGLDIARGEYIGFVDSDDWIEPEMYKVLVESCVNNKSDISMCGINYYSDSGCYIRSDFINDGTLYKEELIRTLFESPNKVGGYCLNKLITKRVIGDTRFPDRIRMAEDWVFLFLCFCNCYIARHENKAYYNLIERPDSATRINEAEAYYGIIFQGKRRLLHMARKHSAALESIAIDKYLDDCIRYSNIIRNYGKDTNTNQWAKFIRLRLQVVKEMPRIVFKKLLPKNKIRGFLYSMIKG